jgi:hypothetical protein
MPGDWPADPVFTLINTPLRTRTADVKFAPSSRTSPATSPYVLKDWTLLFRFRRESLKKLQKNYI